MTRRIHVISPLTTAEFRCDSDFAAFSHADLLITQEGLDYGTASIECEVDEALSIPDTLRKAVRAEKDGASAIIIDCFVDPGLKAARELLRIPVVGPGESAMHMAATLGHKFTVVTILDRVIPMIMNNVRNFGLENKLASIRTVEVAVLDLEKDKDALYRLLGQESIAAVREDKAHAIVLGCTGMMGCADVIMEMLEKEFGVYIPVIDPVPAAIVCATGLLTLNISHSKMTYPNPPSKLRTGYDLGQ